MTVPVSSEKIHICWHINKSRPFLLLLYRSLAFVISMKDCNDLMLCILLCTIPYMLGNTLFLHPPEEKFLSDIT